MRDYQAIKESILSHIQSDNYKRKNASALYKTLGLSDTISFSQMTQILTELEQEHLIGRTRKGTYDLFERLGFVKGTIVIKESGYGFVSSPDFDEDFFVPRDKTKGAMSGDLVIVKTDNKDPKGPSGEVVEILERAYTYLFGTVVKKNKHYYVEPDDYRVTTSVYLKDTAGWNLKPGLKVKVFLTKYYPDGRLDGEVVQVLGDEDTPGLDITTVVLASGIRTEFNDEIQAELKNLPSEVEEKDLINRRDLRNKPIVTIDGADAKDFDDAVYAEKLSNGNYRLGVYIADVSHYVHPGQAIDAEAEFRQFSVYLPDRVYPMLPEKLSNNLCSLQPDKIRLVLACEMEISSQGKVISHEIFEGYIQSIARLTYDQANRFFKTGEGISNPAVEQNLNVMRELAQIIGEVRNSRGALDFNVKEAKVILSKTGKVLDVVLRSRDEAEQLIESFMIQANEVVAEAMEWSKVPMVFRIHDEPKEEKIAQFKAISRLLGYNIPEKTPKIHIKTLQKILVDSENKPYGIFLHNLLLRSMAKARYDSVNIGHYGLASGCYTHFTSPIRRYPDLTVHRLVKKYLLNHSDFQSQDEQLVASVSSQASQQERLIERLERDVLDMKKCEYMEQFIDRTFTGVISSVVPWGFYVELPNTIEGLVSVDNMGPDYYLFNEERLEWRGQYSGKRYRIGDIVNVVLLDASKKRRQISFQIEQATK